MIYSKKGIRWLVKKSQCCPVEELDFLVARRVGGGEGKQDAGNFPEINPSGKRLARTFIPASGKK